MANLGRLEKVDLNKAWKDEQQDFTPWLAQPENLKLLGEALGIDLELEAQEKNVGPFRADILCKDTLDGSWVLIENQLYRTDHTHLGQIMTYAAGLEAVTVVWIAQRFTDEHRAALDWLNEITGDKYSFFGLEVELWRIGDSPVAPKFNIVSKPNDWTKGGYRRGPGETTDHQRFQLGFWTAFKGYMEEKSSIKCAKPYPQGWMTHSMGRSGFYLASVISIWDSDTGTGKPEMRVELTMDGVNAKHFFALLFAQKDDIERKIGQPLQWYNPENKKVARIYAKQATDFLDRAKWPGQFEWLLKNLETFHRVFGPLVKTLDAPTSSAE
jgi:hypothetical protein